MTEGREDRVPAKGVTSITDAEVPHPPQMTAVHDRDLRGTLACGFNPDRDPRRQMTGTPGADRNHKTNHAKSRGHTSSVRRGPRHSVAQSRLGGKGRGESASRSDDLGVVGVYEIFNG